MVTAQKTSAGFDLRDFTQRYTAAWNGCDTAAMGELVTEDIIWADPALTVPARGVAEVQEFMRSSFRAFPDLHFTEPDPPVIATTGDAITWAWRMTGTHRGVIDPPGFAPTGKRMTVDGVDIWIMRDGRIADYRAFYDMAGLAQQLGIMPAAGSRAEKVTVALQRAQARFSK